MRTHPLISLVCSAVMTACVFDNSVVVELPHDASESGDSTEPASPTTSATDPPSPTTTEADDPTSTVSSTSGSPTDDDATGAPAAMCGNGVVEEGEACDDGFNENGADKACDANCQKGFCGDGHVQPALGEICDNGPMNLPIPGYEQCSTACQIGAHCGDGELQPEHGEECEVSGDEFDDNCAATCAYQPRFVFLTSAPTSGALGGTAGADAWCNMLVAARPELTGTYRAWLLVDGQTLADRFPEYTGVAPSWNFTTVGGDVVAKTLDELVALGPAHPIVYTEAGDPLPEVPVWTNIAKTGQAAGGDCGQWTAADASTALVGYSGFHPDEGPDSAQWHAERLWTDYNGFTFPCKEVLPHLYCVQVAG
jgi:hypothetical protein